MYPMYALAFNPTITTYVAEMSIIKYRKLDIRITSKMTSHPEWASEVAEKFSLKWWRFIELALCLCWHFSVNFNVNIVGVQPFIQCKIAGGFYSPHSATFYVPLSDLFLNIERLQLKYLEVIWQRATSYLFSWHYQQFYK